MDRQAEENESRMQPHPEYEALTGDIARLRAELTALVLQKDELELIDCRRVETAYLRRFGALELKLYEAWCQYLRQKKRMTMIRANLNRREKPDVDGIERELDRDLAKHRQELAERMQQLESVMTPRKSTGLSRSGQQELKKLYRQAVKCLHPDLHPEASEDDFRRLNGAMRAYRAGDLEGLRALCQTLDPDSKPEAEFDSLEQLRAEKDKLRSEVRSFVDRIEQIKESYPYSMRVYLEDEEKGRQKQKELTERILELRRRAEAYASKASALVMGGEDDSE